MSTYPNRSELVNQIFGNTLLNEILLVPLDFAKTLHLVRFCLGDGSYVKKAMDIKNDDTGLEYLVKQVESTRKRRGIKKHNVIICSENPHSYAKHFLLNLKGKGYAVVEVNAAEAKKFRKTSLASSDKIDLDGIANTVINRRARNIVEADEIYSALILCTRNYKRYTKDQANQKNRIHKLIEELFCGFLNKKQSGIEGFSKASLELMKDNFSVYKIRNMKLASLTQKLKKHRVHNPEEAAKKLKKLAESANSPQKVVVDSLANSLKNAVNYFESIQQAAFNEEQMIARLLVQCPYFVLMTIPGIGVIRAGAMAAEFGAPSNWNGLDKMCAYAGIVPSSYQSGGSDSETKVGGLSRKCNRRLKDVVLQAGFDMGRFSHPAGKYLPELKEHGLQAHYNRVAARGGKTGLSTGKKIIRVMRSIVRSERVYMPEKATELTVEEHDIFMEAVFESLDNKLKSYKLEDLGEANRFEQMKKTHRDLIKAQLEQEF